MFYSIAFFAISFLYSAFASPTQGGRRSGPVGSIYFITNSLDGNDVVSLDIDSEGLLSYSNIVSAQGLGGHDVSPSPVLDPISSQGSIVIHSQRRFAATVNPASNTIQLFKVDAEDTSLLTPLGNAISSLGDWPVSVAFNAAGDLLCVINNGKYSSVACFHIEDGGRSLIPGRVWPVALGQTTPPSSPSDTMGTVVFAPDQIHLLVTIKGIATNLKNRPGRLSVYQIDPSSAEIILGAPIDFAIPSPGGLPYSLTPVPGRQAFLGSDFHAGANVYDYSTGWDNVSISTLQISSQLANCWSAHSTKTDTYFVTDTGSAIINEVQLSGNLKPKLLRQYPVTGAGPNEPVVATIGDTDYLYVTLPNITSIGAYRLDGPGNAQLIQTYNVTVPVTEAGGSIDPHQMTGIAMHMKSRELWRIL